VAIDHPSGHPSLPGPDSADFSFSMETMVNLDSGFLRSMLAEEEGLVHANTQGNTTLSNGQGVDVASELDK
jgi:hypothetical protein